MADDTQRGNGDGRDESRQTVAQRANQESQGPGTGTRNGRAADGGGQRRRTGRSVDTDSKTEQVATERPERNKAEAPERPRADAPERGEAKAEARPQGDGRQPEQPRPPSAPETRVDLATLKE